MAKVRTINTGDMNSRITVASVSQAPDGQGGSYETLGDKFSCYAYVETLTGSRAFEAYQIKSKQSYRMVMRKRDITTKDLIKYGSLTLTIHSVADVGFDLLELICFQ